MKQKKKSDVAVLLDYAGSHKGLTFLGLALSAVSMLLSMAPYICIWLAARDLIAVAPDWTTGAERRPIRLAGVRLCGGRHHPVFCGIDVYPSGCLPHGVQYPQAGRGPCDEGPAGLFRLQRLRPHPRAAGRGGG